MGKLLDWDNMPPVGTPVVFKGYRTGLHSHWGFQVGKTYHVGEGKWSNVNYGNDFIFELATPFAIKEGDYIDSREFSREECERFCELAVECGFNKSSCFDFNDKYLGIGVCSGRVNSRPNTAYLKNDITTQFREFLDKEKGVKKFTKSDLKDGMRVEIRHQGTYYVCGDWLMQKDKWRDFCELSAYSESLEWIFEDCDDSIIKVTDRDGTVLFEREEEPRELTIDEIAKAFNLPVERVRIKK